MENQNHLNNVLWKSIYPGSKPPGHGDPVLGVGDLHLAVALHHQVVVDAPWLDRVYEVDQRHPRRDHRILETLDCRGLAGFGQLLVHPLDDLALHQLAVAVVAALHNVHFG